MPTMMIHKQSFDLAGGAMLELSVPAGSKILTYQAQGTLVEAITVWYEFEMPGHDVQPSRMVSLYILIRGTGHETPSDVRRTVEYATTIQLNDFVWHIFHRIGE